MAKLIFVKNQPKKQSTLVRMAADQATLDLFGQYTSTLYDIVDITADEFSNLQTAKKHITGETDGTFTYEDNGMITEIGTWVTPTATSCKAEQTHILSILDKWLANAPANALKTRVQTYRNTVNAINFDTLFADESFSFPGTIELYVSNQGSAPVHPLELL